MQTKMFSEAGEASASARIYLSRATSALQRVVEKIHLFDPALVITCARGSSDHAATYAKYMIEKHLGLPVASHAPSMSSLFKRPLKMDRALFICISQSGGSPDLVESAKLARQQGAFTVALVNETASPLAEACEYVIPLYAGPELSVAATKSYILSLVAIAHLTACLSRDQDLLADIETLPQKLSDAWTLEWGAALPILTPARNFFVVGRGLGLGIAQEAALKFKETSGLHAESYSAAEVRHGPMALVEKNMPVLLFVPQDASTKSFDVIAEDFIQRGAKVISVGKSYRGAVVLPTIDGLAPELSVICMIQTFYKLVNRLSLERGLNPDSPPSLRKVTETV
ncbi:SIS domain-containing protein [Paremcibacter congregatus]|uniref:Iron dicitrate transport regulator FecR n=1 Tax=Paremcibacter congregatus TaxID=2043170 RepID=A0A2G4YR17_9PROT|nr:iron dicitrate transport regulator FecR [Paremcibacter congregatus]QDE29335.1 SIS domain-containing protein [Paremcibacter congregatus]